MYVGFFLTKESRRLIKVLFPARHANTRYDHVTLNLTGAPLDKVPDSVIAYAQASDDKAHVLLIEVDGKRERPDGAYYHVTLSYHSDLRSRDMSDRIPDMRMKKIVPTIDLVGAVKLKGIHK